MLEGKVFVTGTRDGLTEQVVAMSCTSYTIGPVIAILHVHASSRTTRNSNNRRIGTTSTK